MELLTQAIDVFLHVDKHLAALVVEYGIWVYAILFVVVFCETGLVVTPFLPGDSLLFAAGALCTLGGTAEGGMSMLVLVPLLIVAAILGDAVNFAVGTAVGPGFLAKDKIRFIKREHLERTSRFYEKYGGKTIILARFVPIVRTFAPFVAGIGKMTYGYFITYNIVGGIVWVLLFTFSGYFFGNIPFMRDNFEYVIIVIILVSVLPMIYEGWKARNETKAEKK